MAGEPETADEARRMFVVVVRGLPQAQGSVRAFKNRAGKVWVATEGNRPSSPLGAWRTAIATEARRVFATVPVPREAVRVRVTLMWPRPAGHFGKKGLLASAPALKKTKPDVDKAARAVLDALSGIAYVDDVQVVALTIQKAYGELPGAEISIEVLE